MKTLKLIGCIIGLCLALGLSGCGSRSSAPSPTKIYMFPTTTLYDGNLKGGLSDARTGADAIALANRPAGLAGKTVHAFISISSTDSIASMPTNFDFPNNIPIYNVDGTLKIADNWADLMDGYINTSLGSAFSMPDSDYWWSGSNDNGLYDSVNNCNSWTSNLASVNGEVGLKNTIGPTWINNGRFQGIVHVYVLSVAY